MGKNRRGVAAQRQQAEGAGADGAERQPAGGGHVAGRQLVQGQAQQQDDQDAHGQRHREGPQGIGDEEHAIGFRRRQHRHQSAARGRRDFRRHDGQQPDRRHLLQRMLLLGEHEEGDQEPAGERDRHIQPPQHMGDVERHIPPHGNAEGDEAVHDGGQTHGNGAKEHGHHRMLEDALGLMAEEDPARGIEHGKQREEADIEQPQRHRDGMLAGKGDGELVQRQRQHAGAHGGREPVGRELAHRLAQTAERHMTAGSGLRCTRRRHDNLLWVGLVARSSRTGPKIPARYRSHKQIFCIGSIFI